MLSELEIHLEMKNEDAETSPPYEKIMERLQKLIDVLKRHEEEFYNEVLKSENSNFLINSYYSLYLRFLTMLYSELSKNDTTNYDIAIADLLIYFLGKPLLTYIKKKEVVPYISELGATLAHMLIEERPIPPPMVVSYILNLELEEWGRGGIFHKAC